MPASNPNSGHQTPKTFELPTIGRKPKKIPPTPVGRQMGTVNRITRDLKLGIVDAAAAYGSDGKGAGGLTGYLFFLAGSHPKAFASLLGKMLPLQVNSQINSVVGQINIVSVPVDTYLNAEDVRKLSPATIENEPAAAASADQSDADQSEASEADQIDQ